MQGARQNQNSTTQRLESNENVMQFWVATLTEKFQICESSSASIRDLKRRIQVRMSLEGAVFLMEECGDQELPNSMILSELANDTTLVCLFRGTEMLESQLSNLPSPGCQYQKYLRWLQGVPAGDERVVQSLWFLSVLSNPTQSAEKEEDPAMCGNGQGKVCMDEVNAAVILGLCALWTRDFVRSPRGLEVPTLSREVQITPKLVKQLDNSQWQEIRRALEPQYRPTAHTQLLEWILEDGSPRLRVAMAEVQQILIRSAERFVGNHAAGHHRDHCGSNSRQEESYRHLLAIANCSQKVRCWA